MKTACKLGLILNFLLLLLLTSPATPASAQWPPAWFELKPSYVEGKITYQIRLIKQVDWTMTDVAIKIPLPAGTRYLDASSQAGVDVGFDGTEITFFTAFLQNSITTATFVVEVADPAQVLYSTHAWITWRGDYPGDYLTDDVSIDITKQALNWVQPPRTRLQLEISATVAGDVVTYTLYPQNIHWRRMWDVNISVPIPEGTTLLSAQAPLPFVVNSNDREVSFSTLELPPGTDMAPLTLQLSTAGVTAPFVVTRAWASWKNAGWGVGTRIPAEEQIKTSDVAVQPGISQRVVPDIVGDVPLANYDIASIVLQEVTLQGTGRALKISFRTAGDLGPAGEPVEFSFYIDADCNDGSGQQKNHRGLEYRVRYDHERQTAVLLTWNQETRRWNWATPTRLTSSASRNTVSVWVPQSLLDYGGQFCWVADAFNRTQDFNPAPPLDKMPNGKDPRVTHYSALIPTVETEIGKAPPTFETTLGALVNVGDVWRYLPGWSEPPAAWKTIGFNDGAWYSGPTGIGYGAGALATDLTQISSLEPDKSTPDFVQRTDEASGMVLAVPRSGDVGTVFLRRTFSVANPASITQLKLEIDFQGGFIAYLNGVEVARRGLGRAGLPVAYDALAAEYTKTAIHRTIDLAAFIPELVAGPNVLAVQAHRPTGGSSLFIAPALTWQSNPTDATSTK